MLIYDAQQHAVKSLSGQGGTPLDPQAIAWYMKNGIPNYDMKKWRLCFRWLICVLPCCSAMAPEKFCCDCGADVGNSGQRQRKVASQPSGRVTLRRLVEEELTSGSRQARLQAACDRFYGRHPTRNDIAEELEAFYIEQGGFLRRADLAAHKT